MNPTAVFSKSGKGVQEASGKTSHLSRADRAVLAAFDGRITVADVAEKVGKPFDPKFEQLIEQLEKDGFVRQVSAGVAQAPSRPGPPAGKAPPPPPAAGEELDFTIFAAPKPAASKPSGPPVDLAAKAREEAERKAKEEHAASYKARQEIERARLEAEARAKAAAQARLQAEAAAKAKADAETKAKADAESSARAKAAEAEAKVRAEADAKVKAAREAAVRLAADAKAKAEAELQAKLEAERAKAREETERVRKEAEEKSRREAEELRQRLEEERKAREEAEAARRKAEEQAREEAERARKEAEEKARKEAEERARREAEELRQRLEEERKAREEAAAARKKAEEQAREEERRRHEQEERRAREETERQAREEKERAEREKRERAEREREEKERAEREKKERKEREREEKERKERERAEEERAAKERSRREKEERERAERENEERAEREREEKERAEQARAAAPAAAGGNFSDSLLADLDSFGQREDEERKAREAADAAKKKAEQQARAEAERHAREQTERREKEEAERRKREAAERKAKEEAQRKAEEEAREAEARAADERKRKAREAIAAKAAPEDDDIGVTDEDLDMDEVKRDQKALSQEARRAARERERELEREKAKERKREAVEEEAAPVAAAAPARVRRPVKWGKPVTLVLFVLLAAGIGAVHVMPVSTGAYEKAASDALGVPVKIGSARVSLFTGVQLKLDNVTAGPAKIATARAFPAIGSLLGEKKTFSRIELDGVSLPQEAAGHALLAKARGENFEVARIIAQKVKLEGPLVLPLLDADLVFGSEGSVASGTVRGPDGLVAKLAPKGSEVEFEVHASTFTLPVAPEVALNQFDMKGVAARAGMDISAWSATLFDGVISGTAKLAWGPNYSFEGVVTVRGMNVGVFAPALVSEGKLEGTGRFSMSGADAGKLGSAARLEGNFNIAKGVLGSFDISRALSTGGRQVSGRTPFTEMVGQGLYDKGAVQLRNITIGAGALNAGASVDIAPGGALSGRIVADVRAATQTLRATLILGGTVKEPQVRN